MGTSDELTEVDFVNPYLSPRRQWICTQLAKLLPNSVVSVASNDPKTKFLFQEWTGHTQSGLEGHWKSEGFTKAKDPKKEGGVWVRKGAGPVTTSCEGLNGTLLSKIASAGFGTAKGGATSFNLAGLDKHGNEPATTAGWHWFRDKTKDVHPRGGDFFQVGTLVKPGQWYFHHVGVITGYVDGDNPYWTTVEAGQGGPRAGFDYMKRKDWRLLNPIDKADPKKVLMGWLDIDEYFGDKTA